PPALSPLPLHDALPISLSTTACPDDFAVARLMMNPSFIARSYFPTRLLRAVGLESVGSRTVKVTPEAWTKKGPPEESATTEIFVDRKSTRLNSSHVKMS